MTSDFFEILRRLSKAGVDFVIVGGFAGVVHGCSYVTQDIDICCDFSPENLLSLQKALGNVHPVQRMAPKRKKFEVNRENIKQLKNLYLDTDIGRLDCLGFIDGIGSFDDVKKSTVQIEVEGLKIYVLSMNALIQAKKAMNRPRDKEAVRQLEEIKKLKKKSKK